MPINLNKEEVLENLKKQFDEFNYKFNIERSRLEAKAQHATADMKKKYTKELEDLQEMRGKMKEKLIELEVAGENAWEDVKEGADAVWDDLSSTFKKVVSRFK